MHTYVQTAEFTGHEGTTPLLFGGRTYELAFRVVSTVSKGATVHTFLLNAQLGALVNRNAIKFQNFSKFELFSFHKFKIIDIFACKN